MTQPSPITPSAVGPTSQSPTFDERVLAAAAYFAPFVGFPFVGPIGLLFWKRKTSPFIAFHAAQALVLSVLQIPLGFLLMFGWVAVMAAGGIGGALSRNEALGEAIALGGMVTVGGFAFALAFLPIGAGVSALRGRGWRLPVVARWAYQVLESKTVSG
jgi:uncharacterized membrane protein